MCCMLMVTKSSGAVTVRVGNFDNTYTVHSILLKSIGIKHFK